MSKRPLVVLAIAMSCGAASLAAQVVPAAQAAQPTQTKQYAVTTDRAVNVTRDVLEAGGYAVVEVQEQRDGDRVVLYRPNTGRGRLERLVIRRVENRIIFVDAPGTFLAAIDERLAFR